jgi:hypothetical protein
MLTRNRGHSPPRPAEHAPAYDVLSVSVQHEYYDISIVCYSCDQWSGHAIDFKSAAQPMIYATQSRVRLQTTDKSVPLGLHTVYGGLEMDSP